MNFLHPDVIAIDRPGRATPTHLEVPLSVYRDSCFYKNHFIPSGFYDDAGIAIKINDRWTTNPYQGESCIRVEFTPQGSYTHGGITFQFPKDNWGTMPGYSLQGQRRVSLRARAESLTNVEFQFATIHNGAQWQDSLPSSKRRYTLNSDWQECSFPISTQNAANIVGGFGFYLDTNMNGYGQKIFYMDDIWIE